MRMWNALGSVHISPRLVMIGSYIRRPSTHIAHGCTYYDSFFYLSTNCDTALKMCMRHISRWFV